MKKVERLVQFVDGGVVPVQELAKKDVKQKNYVIDVAVAEGISELRTLLGAKNDSQVVEEMYYTFMELLERGKQAQQTAVTEDIKQETAVTEDTKKATRGTRNNKKKEEDVK